ncbi:histone H1-like isoform X2 [Clupea harengus]|nr:histone H1-like isoform X2 [Clupea harengus]
MVELKKALAAGGYDVSKNNSQVYKAVRGLVRTETLVQTAGKGTLESYRFNTQKLTDKRMRTRAARKKDAGKRLQECAVVKLSAATVKAKPTSRAVPGKKPAKPVKKAKPRAKASPARQAKPTSRAVPGKKPAKPVKKAKPRAKASPAKQAKNSQRKKDAKGKTKGTQKKKGVKMVYIYAR